MSTDASIASAVVSTASGRALLAAAAGNTELAALWSAVVAAARKVADEGGATRNPREAA